MQGTNCHIETDRLELSRLCCAHKKRFMAIAGDWDVARMTADIPHPLLQEAVNLWFRKDPGELRFAVELAGIMIGTVGYFVAEMQRAEDKTKDLAIGQATTKGRAAAAGSRCGELGFFIAKDHWGAGYASEAARAVLTQGFANGVDGRPVTQFTSSHFIDNPASARVLLKLGFRPTHNRQVSCEARGHNMQAQCYSLSWNDFAMSMAATGAQGTGRPEGTRTNANQHLKDSS